MLPALDDKVPTCQGLVPRRAGIGKAVTHLAIPRLVTWAVTQDLAF